MADEMKDQVTPTEGQDQQVEETKIDSLDKVNANFESRIDELKKLYEKKFADKDQEIKGLSRANTEAFNKLKDYERKELTEKEKLELERKEIQESKLSLWIERSVAKNLLIPEEDESIDFKDYFQGQSEDEIMQKAVRLKTWLDSRIQKGITKGVEERFKQGYQPGSGKDKSTISLNDMSKEELIAKQNEINKMPTETKEQQAEKSKQQKLIFEAMVNQQKRSA